MKNNSIRTGAFLDLMQGDDSINDNTVVGVVSDIFDNDKAAWLFIISKILKTV